MIQSIISNGYNMNFDNACRPVAEYLSKRLDTMLQTIECSEVVSIEIILERSINVRKPWFEIIGKQNIIIFKGSEITSLFNAVVHYLREFCSWGIFWEAEQIHKNKKVPVPRGTYFKESLVKDMLYLNVCTYGYNTVWWDEARWLKELEWMVGHGVNMPLALMGNEYIWKKVWKQFGVNNLEDYFTGPAFLPWHWMGNVNGIRGPLPEEWIERDRKRQHFLLENARRMGMKPILSGFGGFVPPALMDVCPDSKFTRLSGWGGFEGTVKLEPSDPLMTKVGKVYTEELIKEYGTDHLYLVDAFNEMEPPADIPAKEYVQSAGSAIYNGMIEADADAIWVMQSWQFLGHKKYWQPDIVKTFFENIPEEKLMVIELGSHSADMSLWKMHEGYHKRPWLWTVLEYGGGMPTLCGNIDGLMDNWYEAQKHIDAATMIGAGVSNEGIESNPIFNELSFDLFQGRVDGNLDKWLRDYCMRRYGENGELMLPALQELIKEVYGPQHGKFKNNWGFCNSYLNLPIVSKSDDLKEKIPLLIRNRTESDEVLKRGTNSSDCWEIETYRERNFTASLRKSVEIALTAEQALKNNTLYLLDLVDITRQCVADHFDRLFIKFIDTKDAMNMTEMLKLKNDMMDVLNMQVEVLSSNRVFHLGRNIEEAERAASNEKVKELYRFNTKDIVLRWGDSIFDYAKKDWAELVRDVYTPRMEMFLDETILSVKEEREFDYITYLKRVNKLEIEWENSDTKILKEPIGDSVEVCTRTLEILSHLEI